MYLLIFFKDLNSISKLSFFFTHDSVTLYDCLLTFHGNDKSQKKLSNTSTVIFPILYATMIETDILFVGLCVFF